MLKNFYDKLFFSSFIIGIIIGTTVFVSIFGVSILNPNNIEWYINLSGDPGQHIIGWLAYLKSDYFFPIGLTDYLLYPDRYSIMYTDSIPLFSFILKPLYYLVGDYQYFGLYGLLNIIMQLSLSIIIIRKFTNNKIIHIFGGLLVVFSPILLQRIFEHHSLSSHWIILVTFAYIIYSYKDDNLKKDIIYWIVISFSIVGIHFYFSPMIFVLCISYVVYKYIKIRDKKYFLIPILYFIITLMSLYFFGAFYNKDNSVAGGVGFYAFNLSAFINPIYENFKGCNLCCIKVLGNNYEGFAYLGMGILFLILISIMLYLINKERKKIKLVDDKIAVYIIIAIFIIFVFVATGGVIAFGEIKIFQIQLPEIFGIFRATGRFIWIPCYIIIFASIYFFSKICIRKTSYFIVIALIIQLYDMYGYLSVKAKYIDNATSKKIVELFSDDECVYMKKNFDYIHIDITKNYSYVYDKLYNFIRCGIPINNFYFARAPRNLIREKNQRLYQDLYNDTLDNNTLILTDKNNLSFLTPYTYKLNGSEGDKIFLLSKKNINFLEEVEKKYYKVGEKIYHTKNDIFIYGWSNAEKDYRWSIGNESFIILPVNNQGRDIKLSLELVPYLNKNLKEQYIKFIIGNNVIYEEKMDSRFKNYQFIVPKQYAVNNVINLKIKLVNPVSSPAEVGGKDKRRLGVGLKKLAIIQ